MPYTARVTGKRNICRYICSKLLFWEMFSIMTILTLSRRRSSVSPMATYFHTVSVGAAVSEAVGPRLAYYTFSIWLAT